LLRHPSTQKRFRKSLHKKRNVSNLLILIALAP
jgi:hypothetical protein